MFPQTAIQTCIVHLIRNSLAFVSWKDSKKVMPDLRAVYRAETAAAAAAGLDAFEAGWGERYPAIVPAWRRAWEHVVPMFAFPPAIRKMIYTTNALESLHRSLRKIIKDAGQVSERRGGGQAAVPGDPKRRHALEAARCLDRRDGAVCDPVRRSLSGLSALRPESATAHGNAYTENRTHPRPLARIASDTPWKLDMVPSSATKKAE